MIELSYSYWEHEDGSVVGYLDYDPDKWTQGRNKPELEEMLFEIYQNFPYRRCRKEAKRNPLCGVQIGMIRVIM